MKRTPSYLLLCLISAALLPSCAPAQPQSPAAVAPAVSPPSIAVLPPDVLARLQLKGGAAAQAEVETIAVAGQSFDSALRARTRTQPPQAYSAQLSIPVTVPVKEGDTFLATFWLRAQESSDETGEVRTAFVFEQATAPNDKLAFVQLQAGPGWKQFQIPFRANTSYAAGATQVNFTLGYKPQVIEIAGLSLQNFGPDVRPEDLPRTRLTYRGREKDAPWRKAAQQRIEKLRKGDLTVRVVDGAGRPVAKAQVEIKMTRHAFPFGSVINGGFLGKTDDPDNARYRAEFARLFNRAVDEGDMKWPGFESSGRERSLQALAWMDEHSIPMRGHNLIWPGWNWIPGRDETDLSKAPKGVRANYENIKATQGDEAAKSWLKQRVADHVAEEARFFKGRVNEWDVLNEPFTNHAIQDITGPDVMVDWFKIAKAEEPQAKLYINDFGILPDDTAHQDHYEKTIKFLLDKGAPVEGIGMQGHMGASLIPPDRLLQILDRFSQFKLPIEVTEMDFDMPDEEVLGDYVPDFMTVLFSHPQVEGVMMWGFWDGMHWKNNSPLYRKDWSLKPSGEGWMRLVFKEWWTKAQGASDARGNYETRGFLGDYNVTVTSGSKTQTVKTSLPKAGQTLTVTLN